MADDHQKPIVLITGIGGSIGSALTEGLAARYRVVGMDLHAPRRSTDRFPVDLTSAEAVGDAFDRFRRLHGDRIASVIHLAAYFDFSGEPHPLYDRLNVQGTRYLLRALQDFEIGQFVYTGTMLVHRPCEPGDHIDEQAPIEPKWAYPQSKADAEAAVVEEHGAIPYVLLHLAGLYDDTTAVPTVSHQITRIYERDAKSRLYAGDLRAGQSLIHRDDLVDLVVRVLDRRDRLPEAVTILAGEPDPPGYGALQDRLGELIHGEPAWPTHAVPPGFARLGSWLETRAEPIVPDDFDQGEKPFIRPFMVDMASDHYALDITRARELLGWEPAHSFEATLPRMVSALKADPAGWYAANRITAPDWLQAAADEVEDPEALRRAHERNYRRRHRNSLWAPFLNMGAGVWLITSPPILGYESAGMVWSDICAGLAILALAFLSLDWRFGWTRWATAAVGLWVAAAPLVFWAPTAAAYLNGTLVGFLVTGLAVLVRPPPGVGVVAAEIGPTVPEGWDFTPSNWMQRLPIILLAVVGLLISRYLAGYQLGYVDGVWEPFFEGGPDPKNGTEEIITSSVAEAWPVSDAGLGALIYLLEILTGLIGSSRRWRTMPWLVVLFGVMIVPLGVVSITFIVIQPIVLGTWCTLCLIGAAAMLVQIPYSLDELVATGQFLVRRRRRGRPILRVFLFGDTDEGGGADPGDEFSGSAGDVARRSFGGIGVPWNLLVCVGIGVWLMFTRPILGAEGGMADADHLIGALVLTVTVTALAEVARPARFLNIALGIALLITPFGFGADVVHTLASIVAGAALIALSVRRGPIRNSYGSWDRYLV